MNENALVSVIIPAYNSERFISRAISSVISQTYKNYECIVIDDGSKDKTAEEVKAFGDQVKYVYQANAGASAARNKGIELAKGEFIAFLDADDYWVSSKLEAQLKVVKDFDVDLVYTAREFHEDDYDATEKSNYFIGYNQSDVEVIKDFAHLFNHPYLMTSTIFVKTDIVRDINGFDESLVTAEDLDLYFRYCWNRAYAKINQVLVYKDKIEGSLGAQLRSYQDNLYVIDNFVSIHKDFASSHASLVKEKRLFIYKSWVEDLLFFGLGKRARNTLRESQKFGQVDRYMSLYLKSYWVPIVALIKGRSSDE